MLHESSSVLSSDDTFSVSEFIKTVNQAVKQRFGQGVWLHGEVQELKIPGHVYFTLVDNDGDKKAVLSASIWQGVYSAMQAKLAESEKALPAEHKAEYDKYIAKLPEDERIEWINTRLVAGKTVPSSPASSRPQGSIGKTREEINQLSPEERIALYRKDPEGFQKIMNNG